MSKRRRTYSSSDHEFDSSDEEDEEIRTVLPDPDDSGCSDDDADDEFDNFLEKNVFREASKHYTNDMAKLEKNHIYEWIDGEKAYSNDVENTLLLSDSDKRKIKNMSPVELFESFFSNDIKNYIIQSTKINGYDLTMSELNIFIGIIIFSGYNMRKSQRHYWSTDLHLGSEPIKSAMSRDKFETIKSHLKYSQPSDEDKNDRAWRVRKIMNVFRKNIKKFGYFETALSVDEMMAKFFGRSVLKQYIRGKPIRFGLKFWALCTVSGYILEFDLYCGKNAVVGPKLAKCAQGTRVVLTLLEDFFVSTTARKVLSYHLYMDNLFTSFDLFLHLKKLGVRATGTIRENRVQEKNVIPKKSPRGTTAVKHEKTSGINYITLVDSKTVSIASSAAGISPTFPTKRWSKENKEKISLPFPNAFHIYNQFMGGVDLQDSHCNNVSPRIKSKKWTWTVFVRLIQTAITNAMVLSNRVRSDGEKKKGTLDFMIAIAHHYLDSSKSQTKSRVHKKIQAEQMRTCSTHLCSIRTRTFCKTCNKYFCKKCDKKNH